ncbi:hypothetical protein N44_04482 [Microcystis aeruginosa NIES-44]|uniref:Uncharacterized protein n=1 Tax=Microcystis aeruginosa NIES-44 TaxID=449439 RepID=A0A0A1W269_MICAE|nr:hypothetical protein N44_04482 [Microcystis aeruginosa NIES-44]
MSSIKWQFSAVFSLITAYCLLITEKSSHSLITLKKFAMM